MPVLATHNYCTGCAACYNICPQSVIRMNEDAEGFLLPYVDLNKCVECGACTKSCPVLNNTREQSEEPAVYAMWSNTDRVYSSSGGAFSVIARYIISLKGVVCGVVLNDKMECKHQFAQTVEELKPMRGSKYIQSDIGLCFRKIKEYLSKGVMVLFTGTPCQVAGLRAFLKKDYEKLITVDLVCHGVPSNGIFKSYIKKIKENRPDFVGINGYEFRRFNGWGYAPSIKLDDNCHQVFGVDNLYMEAFEKNAIFRNSCYHCRYAKMPRVGDITIADFWGIGKHGKRFSHKINKGVSLLLVNNEHGRNVVSSLTDCFMEERTIEEAMIENPNIYRSTVKPEIRDEVVSAFIDDKISIYEIERKFHLVDRSLKSRVKRLSTQLGVLDVAKNIYDIFKSL